MDIPKKRKYLHMDAIILISLIVADYFPILCQNKHLSLNLNFATIL